MHYKKDFDAFVGGKSGVFKGVKVDKKACIAKSIQSLSTITTDHDEITSMSWADDEEREILIGCGSKGNRRSVKIYDTQHPGFTSSFILNNGVGKIKGLTRYEGSVVTAVESGQISINRNSKGETTDEEEILFEAGAKLEVMRRSPINAETVATGGNDHKLQLINLETRSRVFEEKNVRHDWLELKVPTWISDIGFLPGASQIATCGRYGQVRLYDPAAQRRPVIDIRVKDEALTTLAISSREKHIVVGSGRGVMNLVDLRKPGKILNTYKDFVGGITTIACPKSDPCIVSVGLDRYLRVHNLNTKRLVTKLYLTSRLSCMVLRSDFSLDALTEQKDIESKEEKRGGEIVDERSQPAVESSNAEAEYDAIFNDMAVISNDEDDDYANLKENKRNEITAKRRKIKVTRKPTTLRTEDSTETTEISRKKVKRSNSRMDGTG